MSAVFREAGFAHAECSTDELGSHRKVTSERIGLAAALFWGFAQRLPPSLRSLATLSFFVQLQNAHEAFFHFLQRLGHAKGCREFQVPCGLPWLSTLEQW